MLSTIEPRPSERSYQKVRHAIPAIEWPAFADDIDAIMALKERRNAVILAHNYQIKEIQELADYVGDSLGLSYKAAETGAETLAVACPFCTVMLDDGVREAGADLRVADVSTLLAESID